MLSRCLIDERHVSTSVLSSTTCYFFFKDGQEGRQTGANALKAVTHQLLKQHPTSSLIQYALPRYAAHGDQFGTMFGELWSNLLKTLNDPAAGEVVCVLDALDECTESERKKLLEHLIDFYSGNDGLNVENTRLKLLITSRPYHDIEARFARLGATVVFVQIDGDDEAAEISKEINLVIDYQVPRAAPNLDQDDQMKIARRLRSSGHRTYLWLHLMLNVIEDKMTSYGTEKKIKAVIDQLPQSINEAYERILNKSNDPELARKILLIIIGAKKALTVSEMNVAFELARNGSCRSYDELDCEPDRTFKSSMKQICGLFVSIYDEKVFLLHQTAREFLIARPGLFPSGWQYSFDLRDANSIMFRICVQLLCFSEFDSPPWLLGGRLEYRDDVYQLWLNSHVLVRYAAVNWIGHYGLIRDGTDGDLLELGLELCDTSVRKVETWWIAHCYKMHGSVAGTGDNLTVACATGWRIVVERLIDDAAELEDANRCYGLALISVFEGEINDILVDILLERDLDINVRGEDGQTALLVACGRGCDEGTIEMLLEYGADVNAVGELYGTALQMACLYADDEIVQILLDRGADVNIFGGQYNSALCTAFSRGEEEVVRLLLERGALSGDPPRSLLHPASESGNTSLVQFVLDSGVDIDSRDDTGRTPLMIASRNGYDSVIELLIVYGADVRAGLLIVQIVQCKA